MKEFSNAHKAVLQLIKNNIDLMNARSDSTLSISKHGISISSIQTGNCKIKDTEDSRLRFLQCLTEYKIIFDSTHIILSCGIFELYPNLTADMEFNLRLVLSDSDFEIYCIGSDIISTLQLNDYVVSCQYFNLLQSFVQIHAQVGES